VPQLVGQICLVLGDALTSAELDGCERVTKRSYGTVAHGVNGWSLTGANTLDVASVGIDIGLLTRNASLLREAYDRVHQEVRIQEKPMADGIRADGTFRQVSTAPAYCLRDHWPGVSAADALADDALSASTAYCTTGTTERTSE
jgi:hypothetical protein